VVLSAGIKGRQLNKKLSIDLPNPFNYQCSYIRCGINSLVGIISSCFFNMKTKNLFFTIIALISMNMVFAQPETISIIVNSPEIKFPEEVTITGSVKNEEGMPLANAKVRTIFNQDYFTDSNGIFSFKL
jgi:hypothetical protein